MKPLKKENNKLVAIAIAFGVLILVILGLFLGNKSKNNEESKDQLSNAGVTENGNLVIPISEVSDQANFYDYIVDGTKLEIIAVKADDGTIRTAFNTCQVCYSSGRGYYKQEGDDLVCQNCGNRFGANEVEVTKGGCNPVPIFDKDKVVDETSITISKEHMRKAKTIFENWKA